MSENIYEKRAAARAYLMQLDDFILAESALKTQISKLQRDMCPSGVRTTSWENAHGSGATMPTIDLLKRLTDLMSEMDGLKARCVECKAKLLREIYALDNERYHALLVDVYLNKITLPKLSEKWKELGVKFNSIDSVKRAHREALELFYDKNLK